MKKLFCTVLASALMSGCLGGSSGPAPYVHYGSNVPQSKTLQRTGADGMHSVLEGDTLWRISKRYNISMRELIAMNHLRSPYNLSVGQRLFIPSPQRYEVRAGDNLYRVSRMFSVDMYKLAKANNLSKPYVLREGNVLMIPSSSASIVTKKPRSKSASDAQVTKSDVYTPVAKPVRSKGKQAKMAMVIRDVPQRSSSKFMWPVRGTVASTYGPKEGGLRNDGINIAAPRGTKVVAAENGVVVYTGQALEGFGKLILVKHSDRWVTAYAHLDGIDVKKGDKVARGAVIGRVGSTGSVRAPQLHFETRRGTKALNPKAYLD